MEMFCEKELQYGRMLVCGALRNSARLYMEHDAELRRRFRRLCAYVIIPVGEGC